MFEAIRRRGIPLLAVALLVGCQRDVHVRVSGTVEAAVVELERPDGGAPSLHGLSVTDLSGSETLWSISSRSGSCTPATRVNYGHPPPGFSEDMEAPPLEPGRTYQVILSGCGLTGGATFTVVGGQIHPTSGS
jgi:hypothetical protein